VVEATGLAVGDDVVGRRSDEGAATAVSERRAVGGVGEAALNTFWREEGGGGEEFHPGRQREERRVSCDRKMRQWRIRANTRAALGRPI
jgi:hypothetical protein